MTKDDLLWAATWLYRATNEEYYLKYVGDNAEYMGGTGWAVKEFSWDNKYAGVQILLSKVLAIPQLWDDDNSIKAGLEEKINQIALQVLMEGRGGAYTATLKQYKAKADYFACACVQKNAGYNVHLTPG